MKPFNLERALAGDPVGTRDGRHKIVQLLHADKAIDNPRLFAVFENSTICECYEDGRAVSENFVWDLVMIAEPPKGIE